MDTVEKDRKKIAAYIQNQLKEDELSNQLTVEDNDPVYGQQGTLPAHAPDRTCAFRHY